MVALLAHYQHEHPDAKPTPDEAAAFARRRANGGSEEDGGTATSGTRSRQTPPYRPRMRPRSPESPIRHHNGSDRLRRACRGLDRLITARKATDSTDSDASLVRPALRDVDRLRRHFVRAFKGMGYAPRLPLVMPSEVPSGSPLPATAPQGMAGHFPATAGHFRSTLALFWRHRRQRRGISGHFMAFQVSHRPFSAGHWSRIGAYRGIFPLCSQSRKKDMNRN